MTQEELFTALLLELGPPPPPPSKVFDERTHAWKVWRRDGDVIHSWLVDANDLTNRVKWDPTFYEYYELVCRALKRYERPYVEGMRALWPETFEEYIRWIEAH